MPFPSVRRGIPRAGTLLSLLALAACGERGAPLSPETPPTAPLEVARIACTVQVRARTMTCAHPEGLGGDARGLIVGSQGLYVKLTSSNVSYDSGTGVFGFDVTVQNLIPQPMGTTDGATPSAEGVRIFFQQDLTVTGGSGTATVSNEDGLETFTSANQPYFQYSGADLGADGILSQNETSSARPWTFQIDNTVETFSFSLLVAADVQYPNGYVTLTPAADTMLEGGSQALSATVYSVFGVAQPGATVTWGTSDAAVATVDASGNVTSVAPGTATITATSGALSATATVAVCPDLAVGEAYTASMPGASSVCFAGGDGGNAEYTYMPINLSSSSALSLSVTGTGIVAVSGPPTPNVIPGGAPLLGRAGAAALTPDDASHLRRMQRERSELAPLMGRPEARVSRARAAGRSGGARRLVTPGVPAVGDLWSLNVAQGCTGTPDFRTGRVVTVGQHVIIVADTSNPAGGFTKAQYDSIALEFDTLAYPTDTINFGGPTDLDTNERVVAFYTRAVNELSPPASSSVVTGYFTSRDLFSSAAESCPKSNESEMFYMLVPDPTGAVNSNVRTVSSVRGGTVGTMAHELQHLINAARRVYINEAAGFEEVWLNEGLSHIAEELVFYRTSVGLAPRGNIQLASLTTGPSASRRVAAFNTYSNQNFGRLRSWLQRPDTTGAFKTNDALATRGAIWAFLRYSADRVNGNDAAFWSALVNSETSGVSNLQTVLGADPNLWLRDWVASMYADDAVTGIGTAYTNPSWNFRSVYGGLGGFPLGTRALTNATPLTLSYSRGGGSAYARFGVPTGQFATVTALSGGSIPSSPYSLIVMRTK